MSDNTQNTNKTTDTKTIVLPFNEQTSLYVAQVTKSVASGLTAYHSFLTELGEKQSVDVIVNEALKKGLATAIRYQATVVRNNIGDKVQTMSKIGVDASALTRFIETNTAICDALRQLADDVQKGTA